MIIQLPLCQYTYPLYHSYPIMEHTYNTFILKTLERKKSGGNSVQLFLCSMYNNLKQENKREKC